MPNGRCSLSDRLIFRLSAVSGFCQRCTSTSIQCRGLVVPQSSLTPVELQRLTGLRCFPITPDLAAASQAQADVKSGVTGVTVAQYFGSLPGVHAAAQYLGNTIFVNTNYFASIGDGWALLTLLHESLHLFGLGDQEIENAFGISKATATSSGSDSITSKLFEKCNGK